MEPHEAVWQFKHLPPEAEQGRARGGRVLEESSGIAARCHSASAAAEITEPLNRKERALFNELVRTQEEAALRHWSREEQIFVEESKFLAVNAKEKIGEGAEQQVYLTASGESVLKTNDAIMHGTWLEFFNRIALHNWIFPETAYRLIGFTEAKGKLAAVIEQQFFLSSKGVGRIEVEQDMTQRDYRRMRNDDYYNSEFGIIIEDLHDENVLATDRAGVFLYFDPIIYLETADLKLGGSNLYRFPFK